MSKRIPDTESELRLPSELWHWSERLRVRFRQDCRHGIRPCPYISCEHHLLLEVDPENPNVWKIRPEEIHEMKATCGMDLLEQQGIVSSTEPLQSKSLPDMSKPCHLTVNTYLADAPLSTETSTSPK